MLGKRTIVISSLLIAAIAGTGYAIPSLYKEDSIGGKSKVKAEYKNKDLKNKMEKPKKGLKERKDIKDFSEELKQHKKDHKCKKLKITYEKPTNINNIINNLDTLIEEGKCE